MTWDNEQLMMKALEVRQRAYAPYSKYLVGAAILDERGAVHLGCNVENAAYPQGSCAEANAVGAMVTGGGSRIVKIAIAGGRNEPGACSPCGGCRQRIHEFSDQATEIITRDENGGQLVHAMRELLPGATSIE